MRRSLTVLVVVAVGFASLLLGCGRGPRSSGGPRIQDLLSEFRENEAAAKQKYAGKSVRVQLDKVARTEKLKDDEVLIDGRVGDIVVWAIVPAEGADGQKALALKPGDPVAVEGEINSFMSTSPTRGLFQLKPARLAP
jgi:hypothetical protein